MSPHSHIALVRALALDRSNSERTRKQHASGSCCPSATPTVAQSGVRLRVVAAAIVVVLLGSASFAAAKSRAAEIEVTVPCVITAIDTPPDVSISGSGFTPSAEFTVTTDGNQASIDAPHTDALGNIDYHLFTPVGRFGPDQPIRLDVTDSAGVTASTSFLMVYRSLQLPKRSRPNATVLWRGWGFPVDERVHVFAEYRGRIRAHAVLGTATGPCGQISRRMRILPRHASDGLWRIGAGTSPDPARVLYIHRVRKTASAIRDLGEET